MRDTGGLLRPVLFRLTALASAGIAAALGLAPSPASAAEIRVEGLALAIEGGRIRIPAITFRGPTLDAPLLSSLVGAQTPSALAARLKTISAQQIEMPELALEVIWNGVGHRVDCRNLKASNITNGRASSSSMEGCAWTTEREGVAGTIRKGGVEHVATDEVDLAALLGISSLEDLVRAPLPASRVRIEKPTFFAGEGQAVAVASAEFRPAEGGGMAIEVKDFSLSAPPTPGRPAPSGTVGLIKVGISPQADTRFRMSAEALQFTSGSIAYKVRAATLEGRSGFDVASTAGGTPTPVASDLAHILGQASALSLTDVSAADMSDSSRGRWTLRGMTARKRLDGGGKPAGLDVDIAELAMTTQILPQAGPSLSDLGYDAIRLSGKVAAKLDLDRRTLEIETVSVKLPDMGEATVSARFSDVPAAIAGEDPRVAAAALRAARATGFTISLTNLGLAERLVSAGAARSNRPPRDVRAGYAAVVTATLRAKLGSSQAAVSVIDAVGRFIENPGTLTIDANSDETAGNRLPEPDDVSSMLGRFRVTSTVK